jgi:hypothetical protein
MTTTFMVFEFTFINCKFDLNCQLLHRHQIASHFVFKIDVFVIKFMELVIAKFVYQQVSFRFIKMVVEKNLAFIELSIDYSYFIDFLSEKLYFVSFKLVA